MSFQFQFNAHEVAPATGINVLPKGDYDVIFDSAEVKPTKANNGGFIEARYKVMGGEHNGSLVVDRFNLWNTNEKACEIGRAQLSALCHVTGVFVLSDGVNTMNQQMKNKPFKVTLDVSNNDKGQPIGNEVKRMMNVDGSAPGKAPAAAAPAPAQASPFAQQAPAQQPQASPFPAQQQAPAPSASGPMQWPGAAPTQAAQAPMQQAPAFGAPAAGGLPPWMQGK